MSYFKDAFENGRQSEATANETKRKAAEQKKMDETNRANEAEAWLRSLAEPNASQLSVELGGVGIPSRFDIVRREITGGYHLVMRFTADPNSLKLLSTSPTLIIEIQPNGRLQCYGDGCARFNSENYNSVSDERIKAAFGEFAFELGRRATK